VVGFGVDKDEGVVAMGEDVISEVMVLEVVVGVVSGGSKTVCTEQRHANVSELDFVLVDWAIRLNRLWMKLSRLGSMRLLDEFINKKFGAQTGVRAGIRSDRHKYMKRSTTTIQRRNEKYSTLPQASSLTHN